MPLPGLEIYHRPRLGVEPVVRAIYIGKSLQHGCHLQNGQNRLKLAE